MDTREKIIPLHRLNALLEMGRWTVVAGLFDPLTITQAKRIAGLAGKDRKLAAVVLSDEGALLPAEARAALMASLRDVNAVTIVEDGWESAIPRRADIQVIEDPDGERARSAEFVQFILERQRSAGSIPERNCGPEGAANGSVSTGRNG